MPGREGVAKVKDGEDEADKLAQSHHQRDGEGCALRGEDEDASDADVSGWAEVRGHRGRRGKSPGQAFGNEKDWAMDRASLVIEGIKFPSPHISISTDMNSFITNPRDTANRPDFPQACSGTAKLPH